MKDRWRMMVVGCLLALGFFAPSANAQRMGGSLGGYGGAMDLSGSGMTSSIPYVGRYSGFMPSRMSRTGGDLSFQTRASRMTDPPRASFSLPSMGDMSMRSRSGIRTMSGGAKAGSTGGMRMGGTMSVMPPNFGYPFRQPPLLIPTGVGVGMGMSM